MRQQPTPTTDGQLVERARAGDREAFGDLVDRYRDMVYGLEYHLTGDFEAARDLAQEALIQAYLRLSQLREPAKFGGWLRRIALNVYRTARRQPGIATESLSDHDSAGGRDRERSDLEWAVRDALARLRQTERLTLTLHHVDGYSQAEIAAFLGVRRETVKTRLARARNRMREEIMAMVEDTFEGRRLPDGFTRETVRQALRRGQVALAERDHSAALEAFGEAVELQPGSSDAHVGLGAAWLLRHELLADPQATAKARAEFEDALASDPRCEDALVALADLEAGNRRDAYARALQVLPESAELRYRLAWEMHAAGHTERAAGMMAAMLEEDTPAGVRVRLHNNLGCFYHDRLGDPVRGREHLRHAAQVAARLADRRQAFLHGRIYAWVALRDRQWGEALPAAQSILDDAPTDFERRNLHVLMACALANSGSADEAMEHMRQAATPGPAPRERNRWPCTCSEGAEVPDPFAWVRANTEEYFAPLAADARFRQLIGSHPA